MRFEDIIKLISTEFTEAWNNWDIEKAMTYLANNVVIRSPKISIVYPDNIECEIKGKAAVKEYWDRLKEMSENYRVYQTSIVKEGREVVTVNKVIGHDIIIRETFIVNEYGKIEYLKYEYL